MAHTDIDGLFPGLEDASSTIPFTVTIDNGSAKNSLSALLVQARELQNTLSALKSVSMTAKTSQIPTSVTGDGGVKTDSSTLGSLMDDLKEVGKDAGKEFILGMVASVGDSVKSDFANKISAKLPEGSFLSQFVGAVGGLKKGDSPNDPLFVSVVGVSETPEISTATDSETGEAVTGAADAEATGAAGNVAQTIGLSASDAIPAVAALSGAVLALRTAWITDFAGIRESMQPFLDDVKTTFGGSSQSISDFKKAVAPDLEAISNIFAVLFGPTFKLLGQNLKNTFDGLKVILNGSIQGIADEIIHLAPGIEIAANATGKAIVDGMLVGIENNLNSMTRTIGSLANTVVQRLRISFQQRSPSRLSIPTTAELVQGITLGISDNHAILSGAIAELSGTAKNSLKSNDWSSGLDEVGRRIRHGGESRRSGRESRAEIHADSVAKSEAEARVRYDNWRGVRSGSEESTNPSYRYSPELGYVMGPTRKQQGQVESSIAKATGDSERLGYKLQAKDQTDATKAQAEALKAQRETARLEKEAAIQRQKALIAEKHSESATQIKSLEGYLRSFYSLQNSFESGDLTLKNYYSSLLPLHAQIDSLNDSSHEATLALKDVDQATTEAKKALNAVPESFLAISESVSRTFGSSISRGLDETFRPLRKHEKHRPLLHTIGDDLADSARSAGIDWIGKQAQHGLQGLLGEIFHPRRGNGGKPDGSLASPFHVIGAGAGSNGSILSTTASLIPGGSFLSGLFKHFLHFSEGGVVPGSGHGDTVPAMLTPGERVVPVGQGLGGSHYSFVINHHGDVNNQGDARNFHESIADAIMRALPTSTSMIGMPALR